MDRNEALRAKSRIMSYHFPEPHELALKKDLEVFERAKREWLRHASSAISEVEEMTFDMFKQIRCEHLARRPGECFECGHLSEVVAPSPSEKAAGDTA